MNDTMQHKVKLVISDPSVRLLRAAAKSEKNSELKKQNMGDENR